MANRSQIQKVTQWFGMGAWPRFSISFPGSNYVLIVARTGRRGSPSDRIRLVVGTASVAGDGVGGTHVSMTLRQAERLRDGLDQLLSPASRDSDAPKETDRG